MEINEKLNLVVPLERPDGTKVFVHSVPIGRETFENFYDVFMLAWERIWDTPNKQAGPRTAMTILRASAKDLGRWEDVAGKPGSGAESGLLGEVWRLTNIVVPREVSAAGYLPWDVAIKRGFLDEDDQYEAGNAIAFFYCGFQNALSEGEERNSAPRSSELRRAVHVLNSYGVRRFAADVDAGRTFHDGPGIVGSALVWAAGEGFREVMGAAGAEYRSAQEFRHRYIIEALSKIGTG